MTKPYYPKWRNESKPCRDVHVTWAETPCEIDVGEGYKRLEVDEVIEHGDQFQPNPKNNPWWKNSCDIGRVIHRNDTVYRRKIEKPAKPTYTFVEVGEVMLEGDEYWLDFSTTWKPIERACVGMQSSSTNCVIRRRAT